jgi:hypothetical protein
MRLRTGVGWLLLGLGGCAHLPEGVKVDLETGVVEVGPCRCKLPRAVDRVPVTVPAQDDARPR